MTRRRIIWTSVLGLLALLVLAVMAPAIRADRFGEPLRVSLETALQRKVRFSEVRYQVLPAPGLSAREVVIAEDPEFGLDALAYVDDMQVTLRWWPLLLGRFQVASVRLVDASVNLVRKPDGRWNVQKLFPQIGIAQAETSPQILIRNGRLNFRLDEVKSPFYMNSVDLDLSARREAGEGMEWQYEASPARTDRSEQGFGRFSGSGRWRPEGASGGTVDIEVALERSAISEVFTLLFSRDLGIHGRVSSRARFFGPLNRVEIKGALQFDDFESPTVFSFTRSSRWALPYEGLINVPAESIDLFAGRATKPGEGPFPVSLHLQAARLLGATTGQVLFQLEDLPAPALLEVARRFGSRIPEGLAVQGSLTGNLTVTTKGAVQGEFNLREATAQLLNSDPLKLSDARIRITRDEVQLDPVRVEAAGGGTVDLSGIYSTTTEALEFRLAASTLSLPELNRALVQMPGVLPVPLLMEATQGTVTGSLEFRQGEPNAAWSADAELSGVRLAASAVAEPIQIRRAVFRLRGPQWTLRRLQAITGPNQWTGEISWNPLARRPFRFNLATGTINAGDLEDLLLPALQRPEGFLERALRFRGSPLPVWLRNTHAEGAAVLGMLEIQGQEFRNVHLQLFWDGPQVEVPQLEALWGTAPFRGQLSLRLDRPQPSYRLRGQLENLPFQAGRVDLDFDAQASGVGPGLLSSLTAQGDFYGHNLDLDETKARSFTGAFDWQSDRFPNRLRLRSVELVGGGESWVGTGSLMPDNRIQLDLAAGPRPLRVTFNPLAKP